MAFNTGEFFNASKSGYDSICEWIIETQEGKVKIDLLRYHTILSVVGFGTTRYDYYVGLSFHSFTEKEYETNKQDTKKDFHADPAYTYTDIGDDFLRRWAKWQKNRKDPLRVALGTLTVQDSAGGFSVVCTGVTLQKMPDRVFDRTATNLVYTLLATTITEQ